MFTILIIATVKKVLHKISPSNFFSLAINNLDHYKYIQIHILLMFYFIFILKCSFFFFFFEAEAVNLMNSWQLLSKNIIIMKFLLWIDILF